MFCFLFFPPLLAVAYGPTMLRAACHSEAPEGGGWRKEEVGALHAWSGVGGAKGRGGEEGGDWPGVGWGRSRRAMGAGLWTMKLGGFSTGGVVAFKRGKPSSVAATRRNLPCPPPSACAGPGLRAAVCGGSSLCPPAAPGRTYLGHGARKERPAVWHPSAFPQCYASPPRTRAVSLPFLMTCQRLCS